MNDIFTLLIWLIVIFGMIMLMVIVLMAATDIDE